MLLTDRLRSKFAPCPQTSTREVVLGFVYVIAWSRRELEIGRSIGFAQGQLTATDLLNQYGWTQYVALPILLLFRRLRLLCLLEDKSKVQVRRGTWGSRNY